MLYPTNDAICISRSYARSGLKGDSKYVFTFESGEANHTVSKHHAPISPIQLSVVQFLAFCLYLGQIVKPVLKLLLFLVRYY